MKRYISLLLALMLVLSLVPSVGVMAADADLTDPDLVTFEGLEVGTDLAETFASNTTMAVVSDEFAKTGTNSVKLEDTATNSAALLRYQVADAKSLSLDFDVRPAVGAPQFRILNGTRGDANTAFWFGFANKKAEDGAFHTFLQYHNGTAWADLYMFEGTLAGKWHSVHVDAVVDGLATVFVNNVKIAEVPRCDIGSYGDNATTVINSVVFEVGNAGGTGNKSHFDNIKLVPVADSIRETFESDALAMAPGYPFHNPNMASVVEKANKDTGSANALFLEDTSTTAAASIRTVVNKAEGLNLEFKVQTWSGAVQLYITDGIRSTANTAYWMQISGKNIQYYDGSAWVTVKTLENFLSGWNTVRVEADMEEAKFFLNGELMGVMKRAGGAYGTAVTNKIDSVSFVCGAVAGTGNKYYIDDVKLAPLGGLDVDFEDVVLAGSAATLPGYVQDAATSVIVDPTNSANKVLVLGDATHSATPTFEYKYDFHNKYTLEMDVYMPAAANTLTFQIYDGNNGEENTAYILSFNHAYGLRVFNGRYDDKASQAWTELNAETRLNAGAWNKIRFEINTMFDGEVVIYLNDELVGNTDVSYVKEDEVYGVQMSLGAATQTVYVDNIKMSPAAYKTMVTPSVSSDFEAEEVGAVPGAPILNAGMATIATKANGDAKENKAIFLEDTSDAASATISTEIEASSELKAEFNYLGWSGALQMYITNGARSTVNTAYWLQISGKNVQYYDGAAWVTIKTLENYLTAWTKIRVEATLDSALIYIGDEYVGEALRAGGDYGTAVTDSISSLSIVCGGVATTGNKYYIDDLSLTGNERYATVTPTFAADCEDMEVGAAAAAPFAEPKMATVAAKANGKTSANAIFLEDTATDAAASVRAYVEKASQLDLEFKVQTWSGAMQLYISDGARSTVKTAYWLQINGKNIQYYDGTAWVTMKTLENFLSGWNTVRVVADMNSAEFYLNGELMGTAQRAGGAYGTELGDKIDSVTFVCGAVAGTGNKYYIDDVVMTAPTYEVVITPAATVVDFESVNVSAGEIAEENLGASIVTDPVNVGGNALYLFDSEKAPFINYTFASYDNLNVEFDVYIPEAKNTVTFQLFNNTKAGADTAFWLQFNYAYGLRAFNGTAWQTSINSTAKLTAKAWNNVRVEVIAGDAPVAKIYLNGEEVGTTRVACSAQDFVNGLSIFTGGANNSCYIDNVKVVAAENEDVTIPGLQYTADGIVLTDNVTVDELVVEAGLTLDLNGYTLTAGKLVAFGSVIDSSEATSGKLVAEDLYLNNLASMPIAVDGGYKFYAYELKNLGVRETANGVKYGFAIDFANADAYALLAAADCGVAVNMTLAWGEESQTVAFNADLVKQYAALQVKYPAVSAALILNVSGVDALEAGAALTVTPAVAAAGATISGEAMVYTIG